LLLIELFAVVSETVYIMQVWCWTTQTFNTYPYRMQR